MRNEDIYYSTVNFVYATT